MNFSMNTLKTPIKAPCNQCPFRKDDPIELRPGRILLVAMMLEYSDSPFRCHKTYYGDDEELNQQPHTPYTQCAGAYIYMMQNSSPEQNCTLRFNYITYNPDLSKFYGSLEEIFKRVVDRIGEADAKRLFYNQVKELAKIKVNMLKPRNSTWTEEKQKAYVFGQLRYLQDNLVKRMILTYPYLLD